MNGIVGKVPTKADIISDACEDLVRAFFTATTKDSGSAEDILPQVPLCDKCSIAWNHRAHSCRRMGRIPNLAYFMSFASFFPRSIGLKVPCVSSFHEDLMTAIKYQSVVQHKTDSGACTSTKSAINSTARSKAGGCVAEAFHSSHQCPTDLVP